MPLIITLREGGHFYAGQDKIVLEGVGKDYASASVNVGGSKTDLSPFRMEEVLPNLFLSVGKRAAKGLRSIPLVIDAPREIQISREPCESKPYKGSYRSCALSGWAKRKGSYLGISVREIRDLARFAAPLSHPRWNRRCDDYVLRIEKDLVLDIDKSPRPVLVEWLPKKPQSGAESCTICRGSRSVLRVRRHSSCGGAGCLECDGGQVWAEEACIEAVEKSGIVCSQRIMGKEV